MGSISAASLSLARLGGPLGTQVSQLVSGQNTAGLSQFLQEFPQLPQQQFGGLANSFQPMPAAFSSQGMDPTAAANPLGGLRSLGGQNGGLKQIMAALNQMIGGLQGASQGGGAYGSSPAGSVSLGIQPTQSGTTPQLGAQPAAGQGWSNIDSMMSQANQLMQSPNQSDQLQGQQLMEQAQRMFELVSQMMSQQSELVSKAIQNMK
jgi:hypothetical protein